MLPWSESCPHRLYRFRETAKVLLAAATLGEAAASTEPRYQLRSGRSCSQAEPAMGIWRLPLDVMELVLEKAAFPRALWMRRDPQQQYPQKCRDTSSSPAPAHATGSP